MDEKLREIGEIDNALLRHKNQIDTLTREYKDMQNERNKLASAAANEMVESGCTSSEVDGVVWSIRNTPQKVMVTDESVIPPKFFKEKVTKSVNKTLLKSALKNGSTVQGAYLDNGSITLVAKGKS